MVERDIISADDMYPTSNKEARHSQLGHAVDITNKRIALVSSKQLGDVTLLEPMIRLLAEKSGNKVALFVKEAFQPLVELMPHAIWGPATQGSPHLMSCGRLAGVAKPLFVHGNSHQRKKRSSTTA